MPESASPPHHRFSVHLTAGALPLHAELSLHAPWTVLFGPSGSGKSSVLRALCGLMPGASVLLERFEPDEGRWTRLSRPGTGPAHKPHLRSLAWAPQNASLLPHLSVRRNLLFPRDVAAAASPGPSLLELAELFDLAPLLDRMPHQISGGEAQRVNLARACATPGARLLLLDEPFAGADRARRDHLLARLVPWLAARRLPVLSVTHDVDEALLLGAETARLQDGRFAAVGPAAQVLAEERQRLLRLLG